MIVKALTYAVAAILTFLAYLLWRSRATKDDVPFVPGPKSESFLAGNVHTLNCEPSDAANRAWARTYGGVTKLNGVLGVRAHVLLISDPAALSRIFSSSSSGKWDLSARSLDSFKNLFGPGVAAVEGADHQRQRRVIAQALSPAYVREMITPVQDVSTTMVKALRAACTSAAEPTRLDMLDWARRTALDSLTAFAFGTSLHMLEDREKGTELMHTFDAMLEDCLGKTTPFRLFLRETALAGVHPSLLAIALLDSSVFASALKAYRRLKAFGAWVRSERDEQEGGSDLLSALQRASKGDNKWKLADEEVMAQIGMVLFAGHDTVSTTLSMLLNDVARHQDVQVRLREEIAAKQSAIDGVFSQDDYDSMPYLNAVIKESMRMNPALGQTARTNRADDVLPLTTPIHGTDGKTRTEIAVHAGTWVVVDMASANRRADVWGEDADEFVPDRWLGESAVPRSKSAGIVYGGLLNFLAGNRTCPGWRIAILELQVFICDIVRNFHISPVDGTSIIREFHGVTIPKVLEKPVRGGEVPLMVQPLPRSV